MGLNTFCFGLKLGARVYGFACLHKSEGVKLTSARLGKDSNLRPCGYDLLQFLRG